MSVLLSALFAGLIAILVTVAIERWGGVIGGFLATMPTTIIPAAIGIYAASKDHQAFVIAMCATPIGILLDAGFLSVWRSLPPHLPAWSSKKRLLVMLCASLGLWTTTAILAILGVEQLYARGISPTTLALVVTSVLIAWGVAACLRPIPAPKGDKKVGWLSLLSRGVLAAGAIGFSVWLSSVGGALASGLAATFPAIFVTTMVSLWLAQGEAVPTGAVGPMILGSSSVPAYGLLAILLFPNFHIAVATVLTWLGAVSLTTLPASWWLTRLRKKQAKQT